MRQDDGGASPRLFVLRGCGWYLQGSERDDGEHGPSLFLIRRSERRAAAGGEVCSYGLPHVQLDTSLTLRVQDERLYFSMRSTDLRVLSRFQRSATLPGIVF